MTETARFWFAAAIFVPLLLFPVPALLGRRLRARVGWVALLFPLLAVAALSYVGAAIDLPGQRVVSWKWIPSLGINFVFLIDGLSLLFGLVVSGMGVLVIFYSIFYLDESYEHHGRFYACLVLFMAAMLGTVFAGNLMLLFVFWELTSIASFLLIGFLHREEASRVGARQAMLVTVSTGLVMLAGIILLGRETGTYDLAAILSAPVAPEHQNAFYTAALVMMLVGAFGKSAQFPLHFWLPNAMTAPTPVSAYLHSATMVKLGVFLVARLFPLGVGTDWWAPLLAGVGFTTLLVGATLALLSHELKAILAWSTVSQLGFLIGYYGLGPRSGVEFDYLHIVNHVLYKGSLFMMTGVVMHATGLKDIRQIGGLFRRMPATGVAGLLAAATMAGLPATTGFLSKEAVLKEIFEASRTWGGLGTYAATSVVITSLFKVAFSIRLFADIFMGTEPPELRKEFHAPPLAMQLPPLLLAGAALVFGCIPGLFDPLFQALAVSGLNRPPEHLVLWHGVTPELLVSFAVVLLGAALYYAGLRSAWRWHVIPRVARLDLGFEACLGCFSSFTKYLTRRLRADQPVDYLPILVTATLSFVGGTMLLSGSVDPRRLLEAVTRAEVDPLRSFVATLISLAVVGAVLLRRWTTQLISISVAGFLVCFYFVLYRAPDLALTQILIEVVTLFMVLLLLGRFPRSAEVGEVTRKHPKRRKALNIALSLGMGAMMSLLVLLVTAKPGPEPLGARFLEATVPLAHGSNAVNTILVDFRGFDTLGEITVLVIAMLGCLGLVMRYRRSPEEYDAGPAGPPGFGTEEGARE